MTRIMLNPDELTTTAAVLRQAASDLSALVGQIYAACCSCCGTPAVDASIAELGSRIRRSVGEIEGGLRLDAAALDTSATVMANDASLVSALTGAITAWQVGNGTGAGMTGSWLDGMDTPVITDTGTWMDPWLDGTASTPIAGMTDSNSWIDGIIGGTVPLDGGWTGLGQGWEASMQQGDAQVIDILGLLGRAGGSAAGMSVAGIGGSTFVPTMSQILAGSANSMHNWFTGSYVSDLGDGSFNGSHDDWLKYNGYDMSDPLVGIYG